MFRTFSLILILLLLARASTARASALLKPTTGATLALRAKTLDVRADINGAFARTTATTIYANPNSRQIEADFIYTAPENAVVTGFAYWFKGEKVVARVVEKERAAQIYTLITVQRRDPALVEMIGKNTFRARIAPVEARADLKIEVQYVAPLDATKDGWQWKFPLREETKNYPLDSVNLNAKISGTDGTTSNFGNFANGELSARKTDVKDADDLQINVAAPRAPLKVSLFAARDSGADGFFALAMAPDFSATNPGFAVMGVPTYDVMRDPNAQAGQTFVAVGRYRGAGEALVKLGKRSVRVTFPEATRAGNIAAQMWGARRIETLSSSDKNRAAVVNLSKRFGMPSKWTSWLALPASEKAQFERQLLGLEINRALGAWAQSVAANDKKREKILRQRAYDYRVRLNKLDGRSENLTVEVFRQALNNELDRVIRAGYEKSADKAKLAKLARNLRRRGAVSYREIQAQQDRQYQRRDAAHERVIAQHDAYLDAVQAGDTARAKRLLAQSSASHAAFKKEYGSDYDSRASLAPGRVYSLADQIEGERKKGISNSPQQQKRLAQLRRLIALTKISETSALQDAKFRLYQRDLRNISGQLRAEVQAGRENSERAAQLKEEIEAILPLVKTENNPGVFANLDDSYRALAYQQAEPYLRAREQGETAKADAWLKRIKANIELSQRYNSSRYARQIELATVLAVGWGNIKDDASLKLSKEIAAKRENSPAAIEARQLIERADENGAKNYSYQRLTQFAWKGRAHETAYRIIEAERNGDAKTAKALQAQLQLEVENAGETPLDAYIEWEKSRIKRGEPLITSQNYVLRPGDPLISVSAPANCQRVVAILPSGELLPMVYDAAKRAWEARFDVPTYAREGDYKVKIIIVAADGARHQMTMNFRVDVTAPDGKGGVRFGGGTINLRLETDDQTDRVSAFTPWNERIELRRDIDGIFVAQAAVPVQWQGKAAQIRFVVTDKAHNRTEITVDWSE